MKRILFVLIIFSHSNAIAQKAYIELTLLHNVLLYETNAGGHIIDDLKEGNKIFGFSIIPGIDEFSSYKFWHVSTATETGYIIESKENFNYSRNAFIYSPDDEFNVDKLRELGSIGDTERLIATLKVTTAFLNKLLETAKIGLSVDYSFEYESEYSNAINMSFSIINLGSKTIKYISFYVSAFDAVDGRLSSFGKTQVILKGIGPVLAKDKAHYEFENAFWSKVVHKIKVNKVVIEYMDGSKKEITKIQSIYD